MFLGIYWPSIPALACLLAVAGLAIWLASGISSKRGRHVVTVLELVAAVMTLAAGTLLVRWSLVTGVGKLLPDWAQASAGVAAVVVAVVVVACALPVTDHQISDGLIWGGLAVVPLLTWATHGSTVGGYLGQGLQGASAAIIEASAYAAGGLVGVVA